ncbi:hypothetical protein B7463_g7425, partial [Scytalidium lignicola]
MVLSGLATTDILSWIQSSGRSTFFHSKDEELILTRSSRKREQVSLVNICRKATPSKHRPNAFLFNGHLQTLWTAINPDDVFIYYKRKVFESDSLAYPGRFAVDFVVSRYETLDDPEVIDAARRYTLPTGLPPRTGLFTQRELSTMPSEDSNPMLVVLHGLSGGSHEEYLRHVLAPLAADKSWQACVVNSRGCSQTKISSGVLYNARSTWDLRQVVIWLRSTFPNRPLFGIGFSLGANILATYLAEEGENCQIRAAVFCANPWNIEICSMNLQKSLIGLEVYSRAMGSSTRRLFEQHAKELSTNPRVNPEAVRKVVYQHEFDRVLQCSTWGYPTEGAYYRDASCIDSILSIKIPFFALHAEDDPIATRDAIPFQEFTQTPYGVLLTTSWGGHLGWYEHNGDRWFVKPVYNFLNQMAKEIDLQEPFAIKKEGRLFDATTNKIGLNQDTAPKPGTFDPVRRKLDLVVSKSDGASRRLEPMGYYSNWALTAPKSLALWHEKCDDLLPCARTSKKPTNIMDKMMLNEPLRLPSGLELQNRLVKAAMAENMAPQHYPEENFVKAYGTWADGGWGMIMTGNVEVSSIHNGSPTNVIVPSQLPLAQQATARAAWKTWAATAQRSGTPALVQLVHPGRQSPAGSGNKKFFTKNVAPSAVPMNLGSSFIACAASALLFGTPRELTIEDISGKGGIIDQFVDGGKEVFAAGFKGVELHGAHGYLLTQFLSPKSNLRTDEFGGTAAKRAEIVVRIISGIRAVTSKDFCIGVKFNSADASDTGSVAEVLEQIKLITDAGVDFIEISGGTYESPTMLGTAQAEKREGTKRREAFFLDFARQVRQHFPSLPLMVTGGFRTRSGMESALQSEACDMVGIARPAAIIPKLPKDIILNTKDVPEERASLFIPPVKLPFPMNLVPIKSLGAGAESKHYAEQIQIIARGGIPKDTRIMV